MIGSRVTDCNNQDKQYYMININKKVIFFFVRWGGKKKGEGEGQFYVVSSGVKKEVHTQLTHCNQFTRIMELVSIWRRKYPLLVLDSERCSNSFTCWPIIDIKIFIISFGPQNTLNDLREQVSIPDNHGDGCGSGYCRSPMTQQKNDCNCCLIRLWLIAS